MKSVTFFASLTLLLLGAFQLSAQTFKCGTDQSDEFMKDLLRNKPFFEQTAQKKQVERFVPVQFHIVANNDGAGRASDESVLRALCNLNERFDSLELRFYMESDFRYVNNTLVNSQPGNNSASSTMRALKNGRAANVYVLEDPGTGVAGFYSREPNDYIVMGKNFLSNAGYTLEHEFGHFFTLSHTHRGWEDEPYDINLHGDTVTITTINSSQSATVGVELMDGSNCGNNGWQDPIAGDGLCDTPPDYGFGQSCGCCNMIYTVWDRNGVLIEPMLNNVMSYSDNCSTNEFTHQQVLAMQTSFDSNRRFYLRSQNTVTEYTPIESSPIITSPDNLEDIEVFDGINLSWEPVEHAEEYIVSISGDSNHRYVTDETDLYVTELKKNGSYIWSVMAVNKFGAGCVAPSSRLFFTGNQSVAVNEIEFVNDLNIYPNPVPKNGQIFIDFTSSRQLEATIKLYSISGQLVSATGNQNITNGKNRFAIDTPQLHAGVYILEVESTEGSILEKVIIE